MRKVVINNCYGGFGLSDKAIERLAELKGVSVDERDWEDFCYELRDDKDFVQVVEELGVEANDDFSELKVVEIPSDVRWAIAERDGNEWVAEEHRTWF